MDTKPTQLHIAIGGYFGPSYSLKWVRDELIYSASKEGYDGRITETITPTAKQWQEFIQALDTIGVWSWRESYDDPYVLDGTHWSVEIALWDREIKSSGSNSYPATQGEAGSNGQGDEFDLFLKAVQKLIGGRKFS